MRPIAILTAAALAAATLAAPVLAQQGQPETQEAASALKSEPHLITVDFGGGTLAEYIDTLREVTSDRVVNFIVPREVRDLPVSAIELRDVDVYTALRVAVPAEAPHVDGRVINWRPNRVPGQGAPVYAIDYSIQPLFQQSARSQATPSQHTAVHSITELTTGTGAMSADDVLSAIQAALAIEGADDETKILYHEETGLIFARVTPDQGNVIEQTLVNLQLSVQATRRSILEASDREAKEVRTQNLQSQVVMLSSQNTKLKSRIAHLETLLRSRLNGEESVPENPLGDEPAGGN